MQGSEMEGEAAANGAVRKRTAAPPPMMKARRYRSMVDIMRKTTSVAGVIGEYYSDLRCEQCRSGEREEELLLCDRCDRGYHLACLRPIVVRVPTGPWFCPICAEDRPMTSTCYAFLRN